MKKRAKRKIGINSATISIMLFISLSFALIFLNERITGTVVDAETERPIEGAVVLYNWTITKGFGLTYGANYKQTEGVTDKDGKFRIWGIFNPLVNRPTIVIYKKGYVAWRDDYIFPSLEERKGFEWHENDHMFKLERFRKRYAHAWHIEFIEMGLSFKRNSKLGKAYEWELPFTKKERELHAKIIETIKIKPGETTESKIWETVGNMLYLNGDNYYE